MSVLTKNCSAAVESFIFTNRDLTNLAGRLEKENPQILIISNELGYGVVPVDSFDREYREAAGRICTRIARSAVSVHRVVCGIGTVIKDA